MTTPTAGSLGANTPGPWTLLEVGDRPMRLCPAKRDADGRGGESLLTIVEEDGVPFAAVQRDEDARLIAAAPELLIALRDLRQAFMVHTNWSGEPPAEVLNVDRLIAYIDGAAS